MAESFETLGAGNGFSSCLNTAAVDENDILLNPPSLAQTMSAYWNFQSLSYGGAHFNPGNQPFDLICDKSANSGDASDGTPGENGRYYVSSTLPRIFFINGEKYYKHGISMGFFIFNQTDDIEGSSEIFVDYFSSLYREGNDSNYSCETLFFFPTDDPADKFAIGKAASEQTTTVTSETISGIPFIKRVVKSFFGAAYRDSVDKPLPPCPVPDYPSLPPSGPILNLHTY